MTDRSGPVADRTVRFTVSRNGTHALPVRRRRPPTDGTRRAAAAGRASLPSGRLTVPRRPHRRLRRRGPDSRDAPEVVIGQAATLALGPGSLTTRAGTAYPAAMTGSRPPLTDGARADAPAVPVTFTLPTAASPGATFPGEPEHGHRRHRRERRRGGSRSCDRAARRSGRSRPDGHRRGATPGAEAMAAQYGFGTVRAPRQHGRTTPASMADGQHPAGGLGPAGRRVEGRRRRRASAGRWPSRVQIRWREVGPIGPWTPTPTWRRTTPSNMRSPQTSRRRAGHGEGTYLHVASGSCRPRTTRSRSGYERHPASLRPRQPELHGAVGPNAGDPRAWTGAEVDGRCSLSPPIP